jgi:hypothetical protein
VKGEVGRRGEVGTHFGGRFEFLRNGIVRSKCDL